MADEKPMSDVKVEMSEHAQQNRMSQMEVIQAVLSLIKTIETIQEDQTVMIADIAAIKLELGIL